MKIYCSISTKVLSKHLELELFFEIMKFQNRPKNVTFPNTIICNQSPHTKSKVEKLYPILNDSIIRNYYGEGIPMAKKLAWVRAWGTKF